jgi:hypothetical protein
MHLRPGMTPENSAVAKVTQELLLSYMATNAIAELGNESPAPADLEVK